MRLETISLKETEGFGELVFENSVLKGEHPKDLFYEESLKEAKEWMYVIKDHIDYYHKRDRTMFDLIIKFEKLLDS